jgi:tRNA (cytidine/uridine-2'-O-)-methyltransferase
MFNIILYQPEIPPNTGNIIRLCANTGAKLHLIKPLGFDIDDAKLKRAGLDYREFADVQTYETLDHCLVTLNPKKLIPVYACTTKSKNNYTDYAYHKNDIFLFGPETRGLSTEIIEKYDSIRIPMLPHSRSLNLSNAVAVVLYEALRQNKFLLQHC